MPAAVTAEIDPDSYRRTAGSHSLVLDNRQAPDRGVNPSAERPGAPAIGLFAMYALSRREALFHVTKTVLESRGDAVTSVTRMPGPPERSIRACLAAGFGDLHQPCRCPRA